jgi:hypothetical protein
MGGARGGLRAVFRWCASAAAAAGTRCSAGTWPQ